MPPSDSRFQIQKRSIQGDITTWAIIKIYYPLPNSIKPYRID